MNKDDLIMLLVLSALVFVIFDIGGDVYFQAGGLTFIGEAGIFLFLLVAIIFLWQKRRRGRQPI